MHDPAAMPNKLGDLVNADHIIAHSDEAMGLTGERDDRYSDYVDCYPLMTTWNAARIFRSESSQVHVDGQLS